MRGTHAGVAPPRRRRTSVLQMLLQMLQLQLRMLLRMLVLPLVSPLPLVLLLCALRNNGPIIGEAWTHSLLFKSKETFKLAEIQNLEASLQTRTAQAVCGSDNSNNSDNNNNNDDDGVVLRYNLTRLVVDRATGSSLFRLDLQSKANGGGDAFATVESGYHGSGGVKARPESEQQQQQQQQQQIQQLRSKVLSLPSLQRCDWVGQVLAEGSDAAELVGNLRRRPNANGALPQTQTQTPEEDLDGWNLDYVKFVGGPTATKPSPSPPPPPPPTYTMKSLLCAVAHEIPARPSLDPALAKTQLRIVDFTAAATTTTGAPGSSSSSSSSCCCCLVRCLDTGDHHRPPKHIQSTTNLQREWAKRPFQYSSAINYEVAEMVVDILETLCGGGEHQTGGTGGEENASNTNTNTRLSLLLDPTCGSGTFLALALARGFRVEGRDINPSVAEGAIRNLEHVFGRETVGALARVETRDSCNNSEPRTARATATASANATSNGVDVSCVVANLPWGRNSILYVDENKRILRSVRSQIQTGTPCAFITRPSDSGEDKAPSLLFESSGFDVLGQAFVPQRDFLLPVSKKKRKKKTGSGNSDNDNDNDRNKQNQCVITITRAK